MLWRSRRTSRPQGHEANGEHCDLCGTVVAIDSDGRCRLGHRVGTPLSALTEPAGLQLQPVAAPSDFDDLSSVFAGVSGLRETDPAPPLPAADPLTAAGRPTGPVQAPAMDEVGSVAPPASHNAVTPPPLEAPEVRPDPVPASHPYDEVLAWDEIPGAELMVPVRPADGEPEPAGASALDVLADELPVPVAPAAPATPQRIQFDPTDAEEEVRAERRHNATVLGGGAAALSLLAILSAVI